MLYVYRSLVVIDVNSVEKCDRYALVNVIYVSCLDYDDSDDDQAYVHNIYNISAQQAAVSDPLQASHGVSTHPTIVIPIMSEPNEDNRNKRPLHYLRNNAIPSADDIDDDDESEDYEDNEGTDDVMFAKTQPNLKRRKT